METNGKLQQRPTNTYITRIRRFPFLFTLAIALSTLLLMILFELLKLSIFPNLTLWESLAITIVFVTCSAAVIAHRLYQNDQYHTELSARELSKRQKIERALITERALLRVLMDNIPDPIFFKDMQSRFMRINHASATVYGLNDPQQVIGKTDFDFLPLDHAQSAFLDEQQILHTGEAIVAKEECMTWPSRPSMWVSTTKLPLRDEEGKVIGTFGISRDITEKKYAEIALQKSEEKYRAITEQSADGITLIDENGLISEWNKAMENLTTLHKSEVMHRPLWDVEYQMAREDQKSPALHERMKRSLQAALSTPSASPHTWEVEIQRPDGIYLCISITDFSVKTSGGQLYGSIIRDITTRKQTEEKLLYLSTHDTLTGLYNRTHFSDTLTQLSKVDPYPISVMMIDIHGMKRTNDTLGHAAGDELIRRTAIVLARTFRGDDMISRIGGDEFAVLLHRTSSEAAPAAVERLRLKLREHNGGYEGAPLNLSVGVATAIAYGDLAQAIATADQRMCQDKDTHRNYSCND